MTPGARLAAAAEVLAEIFQLKSAADRTLAGWGKAHRFAGSKDRAAIAERVYTCLRRRNECAFAMDAETPRALIIGSLAVADGLDAERIEALCIDGAHALGALTQDERERIQTPHRATDPWMRLNYPAWLHNDIAAAFGPDLEREMTALNARAPLDLRVNTLKTDRDAALAELREAGLTPNALPHTPTAIRLADDNAKVTATPAYRDGRIEVQDEASQRAVLLAGAHPGDTVIDLAAGAGGKALAFAAALQNKGRVLACDIDPGRLRHMEPRVVRAGATSITIVGDPYGGAITAEAGAGADLVFVDAPCSGSGTWRRNPEAKWTIDAARLASYRAAQTKLLDRATQLVKPNGRIAYAVCSILDQEGDAQIQAFTTRHQGWRMAQSRTFTPARDETDGFFVALSSR